MKKISLRSLKISENDELSDGQLISILGGNVPGYYIGDCNDDCQSNDDCSDGQICKTLRTNNCERLVKRCLLPA